MNSKELLAKAQEQAKAIPWLFTLQAKRRAAAEMLETHKQALKADGHRWESNHGR